MKFWKKILKRKKSNKTKGKSRMKKTLRDYIKKSDNKIELTIGPLTDLKKEIGKGGNGLVYQGKLFENEVAVKFLVHESKSPKKRSVSKQNI